MPVAADGSRNNHVWVLNAPRNVTGEVTVVSATIVHSGFLHDTSSGWDHLAVGARGIALESALEVMGFSRNAASATWLGEVFGETAAPQTLADATAGRGPTFWAGDPPYMKFENYDEAGGAFGTPIELHQLDAGPFYVKAEIDDFDIRVEVYQHGQLLTGFPKSCSQSADDPNDPRCRATLAEFNRDKGDAFFGFVMGPPTGGFVNREVGVLNASVQVLKEGVEDVQPPGMPLAVQISCPPTYSPWNQRFRVTITPPGSGNVTHYEVIKQPVNHYNPPSVINSGPATVQDISFNHVNGPIRIRARACNAGGCGPLLEAPGQVFTGMCVWNP